MMSDVHPRRDLGAGRAGHVVRTTEGSRHSPGRAAGTGWKRANREKVACSILGLEVGLEVVKIKQKLKNCIAILELRHHTVLFRVNELAKMVDFRILFSPALFLQNPG